MKAVIFIHFVIVLFMQNALVLAGSLTDGDQIVLGAISPRGFDNTYKRFSPLADYLTEKTGKRFKLVPLDHPKNQLYLKEKKIDFLLTNPTIAASIYKTSVGKLLATLNKHSGYQFGGVIFTKKDSGIKSLEDLKDKRVLAFKVRKSAGGHIFQSYHMLQKGFDDNTYFKWIRSAKTQDSVVKAVQNGLADAGYIRTGILENLKREKKINMDEFLILDQVKDSNFPEVHSTALYPEWYIMAGSHVNEKLADAVKSAVLAISPDMVVAKSSNIKGFVEPLPIEPLIKVLTTLKIAPFDK